MKESEKLKRKLRAILGVKGSLCLLSLAIVVLALVAYQATVTITPTKMFAQGAASASWTIHVNDVNQTRYLPDGSGANPAGSALPGVPDGNTSRYAFMVSNTTAGKWCAVKIELTAAVNSSKFSRFDIAAMWYNSSVPGWVDATLYDAPTDGNTISYINGTEAGDVGYIRHGATDGTRYYLIKVIYSYDNVDAITTVPVTFQYTPLPEA